MSDPAPGFAIRPGEEADVDAWLDVFEAVAAEGRWLGAEAPIDRPVRRARFAENLADARQALFVAEADGRLVGWIALSLAPYGVADLAMAVAEGWRGRGVGRALLAAGVDWARSTGAHKVALQAWPHNRAARALYARAGFAEEGYLRRHYPRRDGSLWDAVVMGLVLDEARPGSPHGDAPG